jgi:uncharacterized protein
MPKFDAHRLDVAAFAQARGLLEGRDALAGYARLTLAPTAPVPAPDADGAVTWQARGESRQAIDGSTRPALHLSARAALPLTCQRCLEPVTVPVHIDAHFIFMPDEASAAALDETSEDDVLALTDALDLHALIEDELLLAQPLVPRHEQCPHEVKLSARDAGFDAAGQDKAHPFAALAKLK